MRYGEALLITREAAVLLRRAPQTLRRWASEGTGPIKPVEFSRGGPLLWRRADIENLIGGEIEPRADEVDFDPSAGGCGGIFGGEVVR